MRYLPRRYAAFILIKPTIPSRAWRYIGSMPEDAYFSNS